MCFFCMHLELTIACISEIMQACCQKLSIWTCICMCDKDPHTFLYKVFLFQKNSREPHQWILCYSGVRHGSATLDKEHQGFHLLWYCVGCSPVVCSQPLWHSKFISRRDLIFRTCDGKTFVKYFPRDFGKGKGALRQQCCERHSAKSRHFLKLVFRTRSPAATLCCICSWF